MNRLRPDKPVMVRVPVSWPTEEMISAGWKAVHAGKRGITVWREMIALAPATFDGERTYVPLHFLTERMEEACRKAMMRGDLVIDLYLNIVSAAT